MLRIKIDNKDYEGFSNVAVNLTFDAVASTFSFDAYFDPENDSHRELFRPLRYREVKIYEDNVLLLTGNILSHRYSAQARNNLVPVSGYSKTGILEDVSIPPDLYPLETVNKSLKEIATRLTEPFGIGVVIDDEVADDAAKLYEKSASSGSDTVAGYLAQLASQRNITLTHTPAGNLRLARPKKVKAAIATYIENMPAVTIDLEVNGQGMHSETTVMRQGSITDDLNGESTKKNPLVGQYRPLVKEQTKGGSGDTENAANNASSSELQGISLTITSDRWTWYDGRRLSVITPDHYINVNSPSCFLSRTSVWFVKAVTLTENDKERGATIYCVLPESFNGEEPKNIFA